MLYLRHFSKIIRSLGEMVGRYVMYAILLITCYHWVINVKQIGHLQQGQVVVLAPTD